MATLSEFFRVYFWANFEPDDFSYILYPFTRFFKLFGFAPVKLKKGEILRETCKSLQWDLIAFVRALLGVTIQISGFCFGIYHLSRVDKWKPLHDTTIIAYISTWAQILTLFVLGIFAIITSWTNMPELQQLCTMIYKIDYRIQQITAERINYKPLRERLLLHLGFAWFIPISLSMVNCMIIQPLPVTFSPFSSCYWFICFIPIMLITFKEFQFYHLMLLMKSKVELVNAALRQYGSAGVCRRDVILVRKVRSISEIPLTCKSPKETLLECQQEYASVEKLQALLDLYALIADGVDLVVRIFSWHLLMMTTVSFGVITIQSYNVFAMCVKSLELRLMHIIYIVAWIFVQILVIGINVSACSETSKKLASTGNLLHKIKLSSKMEPNCQFYQVIQLFYLEVLQRKRNYTAAGFFDMDYKLITSIIGAVTTYLVIIIQFHLTNLSSATQH